MKQQIRKTAFEDGAWDEYLFWQSQDQKILLRINALLKDTHRSPFKGIGKPEPLKGNLQGFWSRRIDDEHRLVYEVTDEAITVIQCRYHY
jgi:toxin YoeB